MTEKLKVYVISLLAFSPLQDASDSGLGTYVETLPALIPASSMKAAADQAREFALNRWKPSEGWYSHQAVIIPVTKQFFDTALNAHQAGVIDMLDDEGQGEVFQFS